MTVVEVIGTALSALPMLLPKDTPRDDAEKRLIFAHEAAIGQLTREVASWDEISPVDDSFLARAENWKLILEESLSLRDAPLLAKDLNLSRFDGRMPDSAKNAEEYLRALQVALGYDIQLSTLRAATRAARAAEALGSTITQRGTALKALLDDSHRRLTVRCIAAGLKPCEAAEFALELPLAYASTARELLSSDSLHVIEAAVGAGKTTLAESVLQQAVYLANENGNLTPVWLDALSLTTAPLGEQVRARAEALAGHNPVKLAVVVDGLDELDLWQAQAVLNEARALHAIAGGCYVLTTRPLPLSLDDAERLEVEPLSTDQTSSLVSKAAGRNVASWEITRWPPSIREATQLPLFALLTGVWLRENPYVPATTGELVEHLIRRALPNNDRRFAAANEWLMRLAVEITLRGRPVAARELPHSGDLSLLTDTGLVEAREGRVNFVLTLLQEWFAARAVLSGGVTVDTLASAPEILSRWRGALRVLLEIAPTTFLNGLLTTLVGVDPGLVGELVEEGASPLADRESRAPLPDAVAAGTLIRNAMIGFRRGLGPLGDLLVPVARDGEVQALGVMTDGPRLDLAWLAERPETGDVVETKLGDIQWTGPSRYRWTRVSSTHVDRAPAWPWREAHRHVRGEMTSLLRNGVPLPDADEVMQEAVLACARLVMGKRGLTDKIAVSTLSERIDELLECIGDCVPAALGFAGAPKGLEKPLALLLPVLEQMRADGEHEIIPPWPLPDVAPPARSPSGGAWVWDFYSREQLRRRVEAVYGGALQSYESLAAGVLHPIARHLGIWALAPVELRFYLRFPDEEGWTSHPVGTWHLVPVSREERSRAHVEIVKTEPPYEELQKVEVEARQWRPDLAESSGSRITHTLLDVFGDRPITALCYGWLIDDLASIGWCDRGQPQVR